MQGARIVARNPAEGLDIDLADGWMVAIRGSNTFQKQFFCDWILGFLPVEGSEVSLTTRSGTHRDPIARQQSAAILGRSPFLYGESIQEALLYRTRDVRKQELYSLCERLYGPSLKARTNPQFPLFDLSGKPVSTKQLTAREHVEIAQINLLLQKTPIVVIDLSSELMTAALAEGYLPAKELIESGKTILVLLSSSQTVESAAKTLGRAFDSTLTF